jgi:hypothetical protein
MSKMSSLILKRNAEIEDVQHFVVDVVNLEFLEVPINQIINNS